MRSIPYFSQWETPDLTTRALELGFDVALAEDVNWRTSGAASIDEYIVWASNVCGMACLKMVLAARTGTIWPTLDLARRCTAYGGYVIVPETGEIKGLIYAPFVEFLRKEFGIRSEVITGIDVGALSAQLDRADFFFASVHSSIRLADGNPPVQGGHLVLVTQVRGRTVVFHNPSGFDSRTQENVEMDLDLFGRYFAGRGIAIGIEGAL